MKPSYGSLFSGVGGFDAGFDQAGFQCAFQVEWDKDCQQILAKHYPEVPRWGDVCEVNGADIPPCDVLIFGSPCQDLSVAGKRAGLDGSKSSMFYEATRIIKEMRYATRERTTGALPRVVVWENVCGSLSSNNGNDFGQVLNTLADLGALDIQWAVLDAAMFGVPQKRRRLFVVAAFDPAAAARCPETLLPVEEGSPRDFKKSRKQRKHLAQFTEAGTHSSGQCWNSDDIAKCFTETVNEQLMQSIVAKNDDAEPQPPFVFNGTRYDDFRLDTETVPTLMSRMGTGGNSVPMLAQATKLVDTQSGNNAEGLALRRLTVIECERLMGWNDDYTRWRADGKEQALQHRYKQCGNGVVTPVAKWIATQIKPLLG